MQRKDLPSFLLYILSIQNIDGGLQFHATPNIVTLGFTEQILIKCIWCDTDSLSFITVNDISIRKKQTNEIFKNVVTVSKPDDTNQTTCVADDSKEIQVIYWKQNNCFALSISLEKLILPDIGVYACLVTGVDRKGSVFNASKALNVDHFDKSSGPCEWCLGQMYFGPISINNKKYYLSNYPAFDAYDADKKCIFLGGYLMKVDGLAELDIVKELAKEARKSSYFSNGFIAGTKFRLNNTWIYIRTGHTMKFTFWDDDQPDNYEDNEDCILIRFKSNYRYNDVPCSSSYPFFCETF